MLVAAVTRWSLGAGLASTLAVGYVYGIVRANFLSGATYFLFDAAVFGLYLGAGSTVLARISVDARSRAVAAWAAMLILWPVILFFTPGYDPLLQMVGLRGNAFLLPFLLVGAALTTRDIRFLAVCLALLNIAALSVGLLEFTTDLHYFFPQNAVTRLIFASNDVAGYTAFRIPSTFVNAHAYGGTMVATLPILLAALNGRERWWRSMVGYAGVAAGVMGVFLAAARSHAAVLGLVAAAVAISGGLNRRAAIWCVAAMAAIGVIVANDVRLQRFVTVADSDVVSERIGWSVNSGLLDVFAESPLGRGLAGGGTSIPAFIVAPVGSGAQVESEYGRIAAEQGTIGLTLWIGFALWFGLMMPRRRDRWFVGRLSGWVVVTLGLGMGLIGTGMLTSIPQTILMLVLGGWVAAQRVEARQSSVQRVPPRASFRAGWRVPPPLKHGTAV